MFGLRKRIKKCPLCKSKPELVQNGNQWGVECKCGYGIYWVCEDAKSRAIEDWNKRKR